ncbi:TadE family protein [Kitasatospora sp. NBC_00315]|uniref:TadE family protein n=1 Tax=Kitasatospora sp. NBC_00315 TaxID=2975963 RepID=UPI003254DB9E
MTYRPVRLRRSGRRGQDGPGAASGAGPDRGSVAIEAALLAPVLLTFVLLAVAAGRIQTAGGTVDAAARAGARTASISRVDRESAGRQAEDTVREVLRQDGVSCGRTFIDVTWGELDAPAGPLETVTVAVDCEVGLSDLLPGLPGTRNMHGGFTSVVDRYRGR